MVLLVYRVDQNIVQVRDDEDVEIFPEYIVNKRLKAGWGISKIKGHYKLLVISQSKSPRRFSLFTFFYSDLIISFSNIYFRENLKFFNLILHFVNQE
jgi:hypothetical protein